MLCQNIRQVDITNFLKFRTEVPRCGQSWHLKPGLYIARASGCVLSALPYACKANGPSSSSAHPLYALSFQVCREPHQQPGPQESRLPSGQPTEQRPGYHQMGPPPADHHWDSPAAQRRAVTRSSCTWHAPSAPMPSGWPSPLAGRSESVCTQA